MSKEEQRVAESRQERARRYLLGKMADQEVAEFEMQYFADHELFEEMADLENELIDSFVRGELSTEQRQEFEDGYLLSPERRASVEFAKALAGHVAMQGCAVSPDSLPTDAQSMPFSLLYRASAVRAAIGTLALAAIAIVCWLMFANRRLHQDLDQALAQQYESQRQEQELRRQLGMATRSQENGGSEIPAVQPPGPDIISLALAPGAQRTSGSPKVLVVPPTALLVRVQLLLEHDDYATYRAAVEKADGTRIWEKIGLKSQPTLGGLKAVILGLPPRILKNGDFLVKLSGVSTPGQIEEIGDYRFVVAER